MTYKTYRFNALDTVLNPDFARDLAGVKGCRTRLVHTLNKKMEKAVTDPWGVWRLFGKFY